MDMTPDRFEARLGALFASFLSFSFGWAACHEGLELSVEARQILRLVMSERAFNHGVTVVCGVVFAVAFPFLVGESVRVWWMCRKLRAEQARELRRWDAYFRLEGPAPGEHGGQILGDTAGVGADAAEPKATRPP